MEFDDSLLEQIARDHERLIPFKGFSVGMMGYEKSAPKNDAGVLILADRCLKPRPLGGGRALILGPGSTFELDEFWRAGAARIVGVDNTNVNPYSYEIHDDGSAYDFPTTPARGLRDERWNRYIRGTGFSESEIIHVFAHCGTDGPPQHLSADAKRNLLELRSRVLRVTNDGEYWREVRAHSTQRFALLEKPEYVKKGEHLESVDGKVLYLLGDIQDKLPELKEDFDLITAVALFEEGRYGPEEQMTEYKMFASRRSEGRMYDGKYKKAEIGRLMQSVAERLADGGVFLVKTILNPTFLAPKHFEQHGLKAENYNTRTPYGWFTILRKAA